MADVQPLLFSLEAEQAVLGLLMTTSSTDGVGPARLLLEREQLQAGDFHLPAHAAVYTAAQALLATSAPVDPVSAFERARGRPEVTEAGGLSWLFEIHRTADALLPQSFPNLAKQVRELAIRRRLVKEAKDITAMACSFTVEIGEALQSANQRLASIVFRRDTFRSLTEVMEGIQVELIKSNDATHTRLVPTGLKLLDELIGGMPPLLIAIGGRPGAGKSAMAATLTQSLARNGYKTGVFSLEDRAPWLGYRLLSGNSSVANQVLRFQKLTGPEWERAAHGFARVAQYSDLVLVDDRRRMTAPDIVQSARNMIVNHGVRAILIDHLLEVKPANRLARRDLEIAEALGSFRDIANEYELPVVVFTQLNRGAESKKEPGITDFKDAGAVEEMARVAIALTRDGDTVGVCVIKNTNGVTGKVDVEFAGLSALLATERTQGELL